MNNMALQKWAAIREQGQLMFILKYGLLYRGLPFAILFHLFDYFDPGIISSKPKEPVDLPLWITFPFKVWGFAFMAVSFGTFMGLFLWYRNERHFRKLQRAKEARQDNAK